MPTDWSAAPASSGLMLKWSDGWIEQFPEDEFAEECKQRPRRIYMYKRGEERCLVEYMLTVTGTSACLEYGGAFGDANSRPDRGIYLGTTKILFSDTGRTVVKFVTWQDEGKQTFVEYDTIASWAQGKGTSGSPSTPFNPIPGDRRLRETLSSVLRPGQLRFRTVLLEAYGGRCCMTGSLLAETLEAAHIMPYRGSSFDHVQNGLLLRADLHRLFDRLLLSVDPCTMRLHTKQTLQAHAAYRDLEGRRLLLPARQANHPAKLALEDHWCRFTSAE